MSKTPVGKVIAYETPDGRVNVVYPAPEARAQILVDPGEVVVEKRVVGTAFTGIYDKEGKEVHKPVVKSERKVLREARFRDETDDEVAEKVRARDVPADAKEVRIIDKAEIPKDDLSLYEFKNGKFKKVKEAQDVTDDVPPGPKQQRLQGSTQSPGGKRPRGST